MLSRAARGVNDRVAIELTVDDVTSAGDERQMGEAVGRWLWSGAGHRPGAVDLRQHRRVGRLFEGVDLDPVDNEANFSIGTVKVDDDQVTGN